MTYNLAKGGIRKGLGTELMAKLYSESSQSRKRTNVRRLLPYSNDLNKDVKDEGL